MDSQELFELADFTPTRDATIAIDEGRVVVALPVWAVPAKVMSAATAERLGAQLMYLASQVAEVNSGGQ